MDSQSFPWLLPIFRPCQMVCLLESKVAFPNAKSWRVALHTDDLWAKEILDSIVVDWQQHLMAISCQSEIGRITLTHGCIRCQNWVWGVIWEFAVCGLESIAFMTHLWWHEASWDVAVACSSEQAPSTIAHLEASEAPTSHTLEISTEHAATVLISWLHTGRVTRPRALSAKTNASTSSLSAMALNTTPAFIRNFSQHQAFISMLSQHGATISWPVLWRRAGFGKEGKGPGTWHRA